MPHINSIRLVNVYFNNATQFYDDFRMDLAGKNTTYDLENGGGKSLLLQMILQTVLPKTYLRREKPVSLLFQGGKDRTSHVVVDWILDEGSAYRYLLTGFSARRRKSSQDQSITGNEGDENILSVDIEHLNWCIFHNDDRIAGIKKVPLVIEDGNSNIYAGFDEIKKYINQISQKGLPARSFDSISDYQVFIAGHNLIPAEWNIIRGINSGENNIESYFRQNSTSRKLIENLFIKIIEDVEALNRGGKNNDESLLLADALIEIRGNLNEYLRRKNHLYEYEQIREYYVELEKRNEALFETTKEYEEFRLHASRNRNLIGDMLKELEKKKNETVKKIEINTENQKQAFVRKKQLEAGRIKLNIDTLESQKEKLESEKEVKKRELNELEEQYAMARALEEYGEYRRTRRSLLEAEQSLKNLQKDSSELDEQYRKAGGMLRFLLDNEIKKAESSDKQLKESLEGIKESLKEKNESRLAYEKKASALEALNGELEEKEKTASEAIIEIRDYFLKKYGEIEAVGNPIDFLKITEDETKDHLAHLDKIRSAIDSLDSEFNELKLEMVRLEGEAERTREALKTCDEWLGDYDKNLREMQNKARNFEKNTPEEYKEALELLIRNETLGKLDKEIQSGRIKQKKSIFEEKGYYIPNEEIIELFNELDKKCEFVQEGADWLSRLPDSERAKTLEEMPYLPYSVIVDSRSYDRLKNGRIRVEFASDYLVPVVDLEQIRRGKATGGNGMLYLCSFSGLILDKCQFQQYIQNIDAKINDLEREILSGKDRIEKLNDDLLKVSAFLKDYSEEKVMEMSGRAENIKKQLNEINEALTEKTERKNNIVNERAALVKKAEQLDRMVSENREKAEKLRILIQKSDELEEIREKLRRQKKQLDEIQKLIDGIKIEINNLDSRKDSVKQEISRIGLVLHDYRKEYEQLISFDTVVTDVPMVEVRAQFESLRAVLSGRTADKERLRKDIEEYTTSMKRRSDKVLRDYRKDLSEIEKMDEMGEIIDIPSSEQINKLNTDIKSAEKSLRSLEKEIQDRTLNINTENTKLEMLLGEIPEEDRTRLPEYESDYRYKEEISLAEQIIRNYREDRTKLDEELTETNDNITKLNNQAELFDSFIRREEIGNDGETASELKDFRTYDEEYHKLKKKVETMRDEWTKRLKAISTDTADFIIREPLEELVKISPDVDSAQCKARREAFKEYIMNIEEQRQKILDDIRQLESYQENFTRRCVQRSELVLGHLKKIEALSRIDVFGMRRNIIDVKIPEFEENEKYLRMKNHIDNIVKDIDKEINVDRKYIASKLSTKELLAQIADMDKAVVKLYKIESVPENSRYYRWERAVGSEGQNNSIYFIFAACLISFIRLLTTSNASIRTRKVIIADNPFGATSAVYLWQPMFDIMKQNDIQLIAPGHRIPREITSKFSVNYLLNQEILEDGRIRVVVKDVRTETDEDVIRFIEPEQLSMF